MKSNKKVSGENRQKIIQLNTYAKKRGLSYGEYVSQLTYKEESTSTARHKINSNVKKEG